MWGRVDIMVESREKRGGEKMVPPRPRILPPKSPLKNFLCSLKTLAIYKKFCYNINRVKEKRPHEVIKVVEKVGDINHG